VHGHRTDWRSRIHDEPIVSQVTVRRPLRLAVFTNQFPSQPCTFFARYMRGLLDAGISFDVLPFYPASPDLWSAVPALLDEHVLPHDRVHTLPLGAAARLPTRGELRALPTAARELARILGSACGFGMEPPVKSMYVALKAWGWAKRFPAGSFDHILAYWGNYAATAAYLYHLLTDPAVPFSMFAHARMDLYERQTYLAEKMLYADNVFLVCDYNRGYIRERFPSAWPALEPKLRVHHLGLDLSEFRYQPEDRAPARIVTVGRLEQLKGVHCLLAAAQQLAARGVRPELDIVGGGEELEALRALAAQLGLSGQVRFRGWVGPAEVIEAMRSATVLVHPSIRPDAMPTVLKEALALGTPAIASDLAGIPEILDQGRCGMLVPAGDVPALAGAIERMLASSELRRGYAAAGRAHAERTFDMRPNGRLLAERLRSTPRRSAAEATVSAPVMAGA
jgi:colanic acid/amylovoran biosynthesis glycosyltransferase